MPQRVHTSSESYWTRWKRRRSSQNTVNKKSRPPSYHDPWSGTYRVHMSDTPARGEDWSTYLRRMTSRPGWSVARLSRESHIAKGTIFKWIRRQGGVTVASVRAIADALGDDPTNALRAAGRAPVEQIDEELELVRTDPKLSPEMKIRIIDLIMDRRARERDQSLADTRRMIEIWKQQAAG